jgi:hypothetical protein
MTSPSSVLFTTVTQTSQANISSDVIASTTTSGGEPNTTISPTISVTIFIPTISSGIKTTISGNGTLEMFPTVSSGQDIWSSHGVAVIAGIGSAIIVMIVMVTSLIIKDKRTGVPRSKPQSNSLELVRFAMEEAPLTEQTTIDF